MSLPATYFKLTLLAAAISLSSMQRSPAALIITMVESGPDVVTTLSGSIDDFTGATLVTTQDDDFESFIRPDQSTVAFGPGGFAFYDIYQIATVPADYGTTGFLAASSSVGSDSFFIRNNPASTFFLTAGYTAGTPLSGTATYSGQSFASLGITPGIYVYSWTGDSVTLNIGSGPAPVPEPGTWAAAALLAGGATFLRWRRRRDEAQKEAA